MPSTKRPAGTETCSTPEGSVRVTPADGAGDPTVAHAPTTNANTAMGIDVALGRSRLLVLAAALLLWACGAGHQPVPSSAATGTPATSAEPSTSARPTAATFDPSVLGAPGAAPQVVSGGTEMAGGVTTEDITFSSDAVAPTEAYLVRPSRAGGGAAPAIVWFHWLESGSPTSNRTEFLEEAHGLAKRGVVSLLVQGRFPWTERPTSSAHDVAAVAADVRMLRAAVDLVAARDDVDADRIALVGHDFGAMYASVVFDSDERPATLVMMAPTARWADWFLRYWAISDPDTDYLAAMAPLDPVTWLPAGDDRPILLQFASRDPYVPEAVAEAISDAAGASAETRTYDAEHELDEAARADRDAWLVRELGLD